MDKQTTKTRARAAIRKKGGGEGEGPGSHYQRKGINAAAGRY